MSSPAKNSSLRLEDGVVIGNVTDKDKPPGRIAGRLVAGFDASLLAAVANAEPASIHEVGCGEGRLARLLTARFSCPFLATDFSRTLIEENLRRCDSGVRYEQCGIHDLDPARHTADLIICCEVLEHVPDPERAVGALAALGAQKYILSVPREPLWRMLNVVRLRYLPAFGNTPGHINHWSPRAFRRLLDSRGFVARAWMNPFPWIMVAGSFRR